MVTTGTGRFLFRLPHVVRKAVLARMGRRWPLQVGVLNPRSLVLWPSADVLAQALRANSSCALLADGLPGVAAGLRWLGASPTTLGPGPEAARGLVECGPSVVVGPTARLLELLSTLQESAPAAAAQLLAGLEFHVHVDPVGPLGVRRVAGLEHRFGLRVVDMLTDGESFGLLRCQCGAIHPPEHGAFDVVDARFQPCASPGILVLQPTGPTPFYVSLDSVACPFVGQTRSIVCHGRESEVVLAPAGPVGPADVEEELSGAGIYVRSTCRCSADGIAVRVTPFATEKLDVSSAAHALARRFGLPCRVELVA